MKIGLGTWRFFLAFLVAISHLYAGMIHGPAAYAVWAFFVLSGYLMTLVLTSKYGTDCGGLTAYAFNRFVRIYPGYIVAFVVGMVTIWALQSKGFEPTKLNPQFQYPQNWKEWITSLTMFAFGPQGGLPVPVAGALFVEVAAYALMPLFARGKAAAWLGFIVAFFANHQLGFEGASFGVRYTGFATGLFPFAAGALVCHYREQLKQFASPVFSVLAWCLHGIYWLHDPAWPWAYGIFVSVPLSAWVVVSIAEIKGNTIDKWLGDLSYPVYLLHTTIGSWFLFRYGYSRPFHFFLVSFAVTIFFSYLMVVLIDKPFQKVKINPRKFARGWRGEKISANSDPIRTPALHE